MNRRTALALLLALPCLGADLPSAESVLDRFVEVTGGKAAYEARTSEIARGTVEMGAMGLKGKVTRYAAGRDSYKMIMEIPGIGALEMGVTDGIAWERSQLMGARIKTGVERAEAMREATLNANLLWREQYSKVETIGEETIGGEECIAVRLTPQEGPQETQYFSKKTGLAVKMVATATTQMGEIPAEILFHDYKMYGGILAPSKVTEKAAGQEITITIDSVESNPEIPASVFALPEDVVPLVGK